MSASLPAAKASRRGHSSTLWSFFVKQAAHTLSLAEDPETGGPDPVGGAETAGPETGGFAAGGPASTDSPAFPSCLCFCGDGLDDAEELEEEEDDELR